MEKDLFYDIRTINGGGNPLAYDGIVKRRGFALETDVADVRTLPFDGLYFV